MQQEIISYILGHKVELLGAILTLLCVWLNTKVSIWGWIVGIVSTSCYTWVSFEAKLWAFGLLNLLFVLLCCYGWWHWFFGHSQTNNSLPISTTKPRLLIFYILWGCFFSVLIGFLLHYAGGSSPYFDAPVFAFSLVAQYLLTQKKVENWLFWIVINAVSIVMFITLQYWVSAMLYFLLFLLAIRGYIDWKQAKT
jgi:nicotinamide mononucleotide transporter